MIEAMQKRKLKLLKEDFEYTLRKSKRSKYIRLAIYPSGGLSVSAPNHLSVQSIENFILDNAGWIRQKLELLRQSGVRIKTAEQSRKDFLQHKKVTIALVENRLKHFNEHYGFKYCKVTIRNQTSRWGSCSKKGNLSFNYRLAFLPPELADYVVVHELCHLKEFNHSRSFWSLVGETVPNYSKLRTELKKVRFTNAN
jgi:predicted metal-dependent hydrolase